MRKTLDPAEVALLLANTETKDLVSGMLVASDSSVLEGTADQFDELRDAVSDVLLQTGFDENYEPRKEGIMLEGLIDKFFVG